MRIVTVLQTKALHAFQPGSSEFKPAHVLALQKQVAKWAPFASFECLSDVKIDGVETHKLERNWPGWWAKMNLFSPTLKGDFLFVDLDTVITGPLDDILARDRLTVLTDFYRDGVKLKDGIGGGLLYLPEKDRQQIWDEFTVNPAMSMKLNPRGDQHFFEQFWRTRADRWQKVLPGQVASWKVHCKSDIVPPDARVVCFHGLPRPWTVGKFASLYR
jgi:hypothetical protein